MSNPSELYKLKAALDSERARAAKLAAEVQQRDGQLGDMIQVVNKAVREGAESKAAAAASAARLQSLVDQTKHLDALKRESLEVKAENASLRGELEKSHADTAELRLEVEQLRCEVDLLRCVGAELDVALQSKRELIARLEREGAARSPLAADDRDANADTDVYFVNPGTLVEQNERHNAYPLTKPTIVLGRASDCDIRIGGHYTSRRHARLLRDERGTTIEDLGSINGVQVNSATVKRYRLRDGDTVKIGRNLFKFFDAPQSS
jgi:hypothetical protein